MGVGRPGTQSGVQELARATLWIVLILGTVIVTVERLWAGWGKPLWLDEVWTAMISGQRTWAGFWREAWLDCNPPLYYLLMKLWGAVAGQSNLALRAPSAVFTIAAALLPVFWRPGRLSREASLTWAALICLWWPGVVLVNDARGYGLLLLLGVAQAIAFARLIEGPGLRLATLWCGLAALSILTHYYAAYVCLAQGLIYLARHRAAAVRTWPATLLLIPVAIWTVYHLPRLAEYGRPDVAWYTPLTWPMLRYLLTYPVGPPWGLFVLLVVLTPIVGLLIGWRGRRAASPGAEWAAISGLAATVAALVVTAIKPSLTDRYLTPQAPLVLLALVVVAARSRWADLVLLMLASEFIAPSLSPSVMQLRMEARVVYGWEPQSAFVAKAEPRRLIFLWDHPAAKILDPRSVAQLGGFFLRRDGHPVETLTPVLRPGEDPNVRLVADANRAGDAFIWLYNRERKSNAREHPPRVAEMTGWDCLDESWPPIGIVTCRRP